MPFQRHSLIDQQIHSHLQNFTETRPSFSYEAGGHNSPPETGQHFRFASLRRRKHSISMDEGVSSPSSCSRRLGINTNLQRPSDRNEADIMAFQRELQNLPKNESPSPIFVPPQVSQQVLSSQIASMLREVFERGGAGAGTNQPSVSVTNFSGQPRKRPRSCSVPKITFDSAHLQLPGSNVSAAPLTNSGHGTQEKSNQQINAELVHSTNHNSSGLIRSFTSDVACRNTSTGHVHNTGMLILLYFFKLLMLFYF